MITFPSNSRAQAVHDVGVKVDDVLERAQLDTARREGAHEAYMSAAANFTVLMGQIDREHTGRDAEIAALWMNRIVSVCQNMASYANLQVHTARGAENQARLIVEMVKKMYDQELEKRETQIINSEINKVAPTSTVPVAQVAQVAPSTAAVAAEHTPPPSPPVEIAPEAEVPQASLPSASAAQFRARTIKEQRQRSNTPSQ
jgi:hypothetical protein